MTSIIVCVYAKQNRYLIEKVYQCIYFIIFTDNLENQTIEDSLIFTYVSSNIHNFFTEFNIEALFII